MDHCLGIPDDAIVSVRCGGMRRQAPLETLTTQPLKFPVSIEAVSEPLKIDVLQPMATTRLVLHPHEELYSIGFEQSPHMVIGLKAQAQTDQPVESNPADSLGPNFKDAAASAKDYLEQHGLLRYVQSMLHAVIQVRPGDPYAYMIEQLSAAQSKTRTLERIVSRPGSALPKTPVPPREPPPSCSPTRPRPHVAHVAGSPKPSEPSGPSGGPSGSASPKPTCIPEGASPLPKADSPTEPLEDLRLHLKSKLEDAYKSGQLEDVVTQAVGPKPETTCHAASTPAESKKDCGGGKRVSARDLDAFTSVKGSLQSALVDAMDTGALQDALSAVGNGGDARELDAFTSAKGSLQSALVDAMDTGALQDALSAVGNRGDARELDAFTSVKGSLQSALVDAMDTGALQDALSAVGSRGDARELDAFTSAKGSLQSALVDAMDTGALQDALSAVGSKGEAQKTLKISEKLDAVADVKARLREHLNDAVSSGALGPVLQSIAGGDSSPAQASQPPVSLPESVQDLREKMRELLQESVTTGSLQEALDQLSQSKSLQNEVASKPRNTTKVEKERGSKERAHDSCDHLFQLKADMLKKAEKALSSGELQSILSSIPKQGTAKQGTAQQSSVQCVQGVQGSAEEDLVAIKRKLRGLLENAAESGKLQGTLQHLELTQETQATDALDLHSLHAELNVMKQEKKALSQTVHQLTAEMDAPGLASVLRSNCSRQLRSRLLKVYQVYLVGPCGTLLLFTLRRC